MGFVLDIVIIAIAVICIVYGAKKGFFKSLMSLISGVCALLIALTFTPMLSNHINERYIIEPIAGGIETTFLSIAENGEEALGYDKDILFGDIQFKRLMEGAGYTEEDIENEIDEHSVSDEALISFLARTVAEPIAKTVSDIVAFIVLFVVSLIALKLITLVIGLFMKLPVLKETDKMMGVVFGVISALFFAFVFAMMVSHLSDALAAAAPGTFKGNVVENSLLLKLFASFNPISALSDLLIG